MALDRQILYLLRQCTPMSKTLPVPTNSDFVFKRIFGDERNIDSLHAFLQAVLDMEEEQLGEIQILNPYVMPESYNDKFGILDLKVKTSEGKIINVEIQLQREASLLQQNHLLSFKDDIPTNEVWRKVRPYPKSNLNQHFRPSLYSRKS